MAGYFIVAGTSTIGRKLIDKLHKRDKEIYITTRSEEGLKELQKKYDGLRGEVVNSADFDALERAAENAASKMKDGIYGMVNLSGSFLLKSAHMTSFEEYQALVEANLTTAFATVRAAGKVINENGSVVLMAAAPAQIGIANHDGIAAVKAGVIGLARSAAATYAARNIRFNVVSPGLVDTKLTKNVTENEMSRNLSEHMHPLGRIGEPKDVARVIWFLLKPKNDWMTGQVIGIDGGMNSVQPKVKV